MIIVTRGVSPSIEHAELTHLERVPIDYARAAEQHRVYCDVLRSLGCDVIELPGDPAFPDCVFVEDTAIVLDDLAVITRPGAPSRRGETAAVAEVLARFRPLAHIEAPATIDGGDVLVLDDRIYVGLSTRTNEEALAQLTWLTRLEVIGVPMDRALHLKTAITRVGERTLLVNREWIDVAPFAGWELIDVDSSEPFGANALLVGETIVHGEAFVRTRAKLLERGFAVCSVPADELAKAEGGVTCSALQIATDPAR